MSSARCLVFLLVWMLSACAAEAPEPLEGSAQASAVATFRAAWVNARMPYASDAPEYQWPNRRPRLRHMLGRKGLPGIIGMAELTASTLQDVKADLNGTGANWTHRHVDTGGTIGELVAIFWDKNQFDYIATNSLLVGAAERRGPCRFCKEDVEGGQYNCEDNGANRGVITVHLRDKLSKRSFYVYATHFPAPKYWPEDGSAPKALNECERVGMAETVASFIAGRSHPEDPIIFMGDFNAGYRFNGSGRVVGDSYQYLADELELVDTFYAASPMDPLVQTWNDLDPEAGRTRTKLDHIFVSEDAFQTYGASIDRTMYSGSPGTAVSCPEHDSPGCSGLYYYSDHWAVEATLAR